MSTPTRHCDADDARVVEWTLGRRGSGRRSTSPRPPSPERRVLARPQWLRADDCTLLQVRAKIAAYALQDRRRGRAPATPPLAAEAVLDLLTAVDFCCTYCHEPMPRVWRSPRDPRQWTLDRMDNARAHSLDNVVPSCMACNLRRRARDHAAFRRGARVAHSRLIREEEDDQEEDDKEEEEAV
jgi:hypothetical protein